MAWTDRLPAGLRIRRLLRTIWAELTFPQSCAPGHFYSPISTREDVLQDRQRIRSRRDQALPEIDLREPEQLEFLQRLSKHAAKWTNNPTGRFREQNDYLPMADAIVLFAMLLETRPRKYVEIGSGFSSALVLDVREQFLGGNIECTFIEPDPVRLESLMRPGDLQSSKVIAKRVQDVGDEIFSALGADDILFVDGSHVAKVGSDLNDVLFRILPLLKPGVLIHFHDIPWPFEYSEEDLLRGRSWNEVYLLRAFLANSAAYQIRLFDSWLEQGHSKEWRVAFPQATGSSASSLWMTKAAGV